MKKRGFIPVLSYCGLSDVSRFDNIGFNHSVFGFRGHIAEGSVIV